MKKIVLLLVMFTIAQLSVAVDERLDRINEIKKSQEYLYGEATMKTPEKAVKVAYDLLQQKIDSWAKDNETFAGEAIVAEHIADTLMMRRAQMFRVLAYVKKSQLMPAPETSAVIPQVPSQDEFEKVAPAPVKKDSLVSDELKQQLKERFFGLKNSTLQKIMDARNFFDLKHILPPLKADGSIINYGKLATAEKLEDCYLIVYDIAGNIKAFLGKGAEKRLNLKTGKQDRLDNYRGCGAIWFTMK